MAEAAKFIQIFFIKFSKDDTTTLAASLAFYTALSLAPLVILFVTISSQFSLELQQSLVSEAQIVVGEEAAATFNMIIESAKTRPDLTSIASLVGILTLLLSSSMIFGELRSALNRIFDVAPHKLKTEGYVHATWRFVRERLLHVGLALSFILLLIVSLAASSFINSALLFVFGNELIGIYLGNSAIGSAYGAAGSVIVLLVWVYYSTLITFIGAQVSAILGKTNYSDAVQTQVKLSLPSSKRQESPPSFLTDSEV